MKPLAFLSILAGLAALILAAGVFIATRKYPKADPPTDGVEQITAVGVAIVGVLLIALGWSA